MIEDRLTRDERIRLEALNQAHVRYAMDRAVVIPIPVTTILETAEQYEAWIRGDE